MKTLLRLLVLLPLALPAFRLAAQNLVTNGGFETGDFTGWTESSIGYGITFFTVSPHSGIYDLGLGSSSLWTLSQDLATEVGQSYKVSLWLKVQGDSTNDNEFSASVDDDTFVNLVDASTAPYAEYTHTFVADSASTSLSITHRFGSSYFYLDDVSVTAVPEPATYALLAGLGVLLLAAWRCRLRRQILNPDA